MVFAGDEVGVGGSTSDSGRKPFPWDGSTWDHDLLATYRKLIALRRGTMRCATGACASSPPATMPSPSCATRGRNGAGSRYPGAPPSAEDGLGDLGMTGSAERLYGDGDLTVDGGTVALPGDGPAFNVWRISSAG